MMLQSAAFNDPDIVAHILIEGAQELLGADNVHKFIGRKPVRQAVPFQDAGELLNRLEKTYGTLGGRGLALRIGQAAFRCSLKTLGGQTGFRDMEYRMLPSPHRIEKGLEALALLFSSACGDEVTISDEGQYWLWRSSCCPACRGHHSSDACCYMVVGFLQEFAAWAGGGRFYPVFEVECQASGAPACVYRIAKKPID